MKNMKQINKTPWLKLGLTIIFLSTIGTIFLDNESIILIRILNLVTIFAILFILFVYFGWNRVLHFLNNKFIEKDDCPYYSKDQCPYGSISQCPYNTSGCYAFTKTQKSQKKTYWLFSFVVLAILVIMVSILYKVSDTGQVALTFSWNKLTTENILEILQTVSVSFIGAVCVAYLFDIPGRMAEYQNYFINLLSSSDYLKKMEEKDLLELRSRITWLLHIKDVPNMPKGLINLDKKVCEMLKEPYFKEYTQIVNLTKNASENNVIRKKITVEYTAFNPYNDQHPVTMDIGLANSVKFNEEVNEEEAKVLFQLSEFTIYIDSDETKYDLRSHIEIKIAEENEAGLLYNGKILLAPRGHESNKDTPLNISLLNIVSNEVAKKTKKNKEDKEGKETKEAEEVVYSKIEASSQAGLYVKFADKIKVKLQYEISVPEDDVCFTKRLRYPVKYFHLDYNLSEGFEGHFLVGQLIGTLMDQQNVTVETFENDRHLCLKTHSWLLPKNGAVIVHCKTNKLTQEESKNNVKRIKNEKQNEA